MAKCSCGCGPGCDCGCDCCGDRSANASRQSLCERIAAKRKGRKRTVRKK